MLFKVCRKFSSKTLPTHRFSLTGNLHLAVALVCSDIVKKYPTPHLLWDVPEMSKETVRRNWHRLVYHLPMYLVFQKKGAQLLMSYAVGPEREGPPLKTFYKQE